VVELDEALREAFRAIAALRKTHPMAKYVKFPSIPTLFSESLVICAVAKLFGASWRAQFGGRACDIALESDSGERRAVEVKATGVHEFQELKAKDLRADALVWICFGRRFLDVPEPVRVLILDNPGRHVASPCRLDIQRLNRLIGSTRDLREVTVSRLSELFQ
jgi:hypothetical protein